MVTDGKWKLIYIPHPEEDIYEFYNLNNDPKETKNLIDKKAKIANLLKKELLRWVKKSVEEEGIDLTEKSKKLLRKLGRVDEAKVDEEKVRELTE